MKILFTIQLLGWRDDSTIRSIAALAEDLGSVPSTLMVANNH